MAKNVKNQTNEGVRLSERQAALEFRISRDTLRRNLRREEIEAGDDGKFSISQILKSSFGDLQRERIREIAAKADMKEMARDKMRRELLPAEAINLVWQNVATAIRGVILSSPLPEADKKKIFALLCNLKADDYFEGATDE